VLASPLRVRCSFDGRWVFSLYSLFVGFDIRLTFVGCSIFVGVSMDNCCALVVMLSVLFDFPWMSCTRWLFVGLCLCLR